MKGKILNKKTQNTVKIPETTKQWLIENPLPRVRFAAASLFAHGKADPQILTSDELVKNIVPTLEQWQDEILKQHNKPDLLMHRLCLLADMGVSAKHPGIPPVIDTILKTFQADNLPRIKILLPKVFRGTGEVEEEWIICDYPQILYSLLKMGVKNESTLTSLHYLTSLVRENGFPCVSSMSKFRGPGPKEDFCPMASLYTLKALNQTQETRTSDAAHLASESLLRHWEERGKKKHYLFGIGTDFKKIKYPMIWYNLLHVLNVLSESVLSPEDPRLIEMGDLLLSKADPELRFTPESMYRFYKEEDFSNKKEPSPTVTATALTVLRRIGLVS